MKIYSSAGAAKLLGVTPAAISNYIKAGKIPKPNMMEAAHRYLWTEEEVEHIRQLLPKIANGRKTRYKKKQLATSNKQLAKAKPKKPKKK